jgi:hypothetical protein
MYLSHCDGIGIFSSAFRYFFREIVAIDRWCEDAGIVLVPAIDVPCNITAAEYFQNIKPILHDVLPCFASSK